MRRMANRTMGLCKSSECDRSFKVANAADDNFYNNKSIMRWCFICGVRLVMKCSETRETTPKQCLFVELSSVEQRCARLYSPPPP
jgi:hypothetical protein